MAGRKLKEKPLKLRRRDDVTRMCRYCAMPHPETEFPEGDDWICSPCRESGPLPIIPKLRGDGWERYDTRTLFAGYRVVRNPPKGERTRYETEVHSPAGVFYAVAEAAFAFETKTTRMANILLAAFPEGRVQVSGDDGHVVLVFPAFLGLFQAIARKVGAYRPRRVTDETKAKLAAAREVAAAQRQAPEQIGMDL